MAIVCDGTNDTSIMEEEVIYIFTVDPYTMELIVIFA